MTERVHGHVFAGEHLTGKFDFFTVKTIKDIRPTGLAQDLNGKLLEEPKFPFTANGVTYANAAEYNAARESQRRFDKLIQTISLRAQPVVIGEVTVANNVTPPVSDIPAAGDSSDPAVAVYTFKFVIEHTQVWDAEDLAVALDGIEGFEYSLGDTSANNVIVYRDAYMK